MLRGSRDIVNKLKTETLVTAYSRGWPFLGSYSRAQTLRLRIFRCGALGKGQRAWKTEQPMITAIPVAPAADS